MTGIINMKIARGMLYLTGGFLSLDNSSEECGVTGMRTHRTLCGYRGHRPVLLCIRSFFFIYQVNFTYL